jgi:hypothetical protein
MGLGGINVHCFWRDEGCGEGQCDSLPKYFSYKHLLLICGYKFELCMVFTESFTGSLHWVCCMPSSVGLIEVLLYISVCVRLEEKKKGQPRKVPASAQLSDLERQVEEKRQARLRSQEQTRGPTANRQTATRSAALIGQRVSGHKPSASARCQHQTAEQLCKNLLYVDYCENIINFLCITLAVIEHHQSK